MAKWLFLERRPDRPAGGDAFRRTFARLAPEVSLAREAIQNAVDAASEDRYDSVVVEFELVEGCDLQEVFGESYLEHARARSSVDPELVLPVEDALRTGRVLLIHDYGTTGLTGDMQNMHSNFFRLMGGLGGSEKTEGGGSYGFGKAAAILNSQLHTVLVYTVTQEGGRSSKLFGTSYLDPHPLRGRDYLGVGWYCDDESGDAAPIIIRNEEADRIASLFRIRRANAREFGTTLALVYPSATLAGLERRIRENWWPRIADRVSNSAEPLIYLRDGSSRRPLSLESDPNVAPFVELYDVARGVKEPTQSVRRYELLAPRQSGAVRLGVLTLSIYPEDERSEDLLDGIALVRKPRMVVDYYRFRGLPSGMRGIFIADPGMDKFLRRTEPHEHNDWSEKIPGQSLNQEREYAGHIKKGIRKKIREYIEGYSPPPEVQRTMLPELRKDLGNLFGTPGHATPPATHEPISITKKSANICQVGKQLKLMGSASFTNICDQPVEARLGVCVKVVESDLASGGDQLLTTMKVGQETCGPRTDASITQTIGPHESIALEFETECYDPEWTTEVTFRSELLT